MKNNADSKESEQNSEPPAMRGLIIDSLAELPEKTILDESMLAAKLQVSPRTVRRMVQRFELPPPTPLAGRSVWMVGRVLRHIEAALEKAEQEALEQLRRISSYSP